MQKCNGLKCVFLLMDHDQRDAMDHYPNHQLIQTRSGVVPLHVGNELMSPQHAMVQRIDPQRNFFILCKVLSECTCILHHFESLFAGLGLKSSFLWHFQL